MPAEPTFRIQTSTLFLTYAQCPLSKETLLQELQEVFAVTEYAIAQEAHSDGALHLHAFLKLEAKIHKRDPAFADIQGYHPNITSPRSVKAVIQYVLKDGTSYLNYNVIGNYLASEGIQKLLDKKSYGTIIAESESMPDFMKLIEKHYPRDLVLGYDKIKTFAEYKYKAVTKEYHSPFATVDFVNVYPEMTEWANKWITPNQSSANVSSP